MATRHCGNTAYLEEKNVAFHLSCEIKKGRTQNQAAFVNFNQERTHGFVLSE